MTKLPSEHLRRYAARQALEEYRTNVGWPAALLGLGGILGVAWAALHPAHPFATGSFLGGAACGLVAFGLLRRRSWSRWPGAALLLVSGILEAVVLARGFELADLLYVWRPALLLCGAAYLALPDSARHFETSRQSDGTP